MFDLILFKDRLREARQSAGYARQADLAAVVGISLQAVNSYEMGKRVPDADIVSRIASACNVSADWLLGLSEIKMPSAELRGICEYTGLNDEAVLFLHERSTACAGSVDESIKRTFFDFMNYMLSDDDAREDVYDFFERLDSAVFGEEISCSPLGGLDDSETFMHLNAELIKRGLIMVSPKEASRFHRADALTVFGVILDCFVSEMGKKVAVSIDSQCSNAAVGEVMSMIDRESGGNDGKH